MNSLPPTVAQEEERLGGLALKFRGTRRDAERIEIAKDYSETVDRLIHNGSWQNMPPPEDQLPDDWMPTAFSEYWTRQVMPGADPVLWAQLLSSYCRVLLVKCVVIAPATAGSGDKNGHRHDSLGN
jgi:hypothetical protein